MDGTMDKGKGSLAAETLGKHSLLDVHAIRCLPS